MKKLSLLPILALAALPNIAFADTNGVTSGIVQGICGLIKPFVGSNSQVLSIIFLISLGVMVLLWMLNENKEGVMVWLLRTGVALALLINLFTLPSLIGLPSIAC